MTTYQYLQGKTQVKPQFTTGKTTRIVRLLFFSLSLYLFYEAVDGRASEWERTVLAYV